MRSILTVLGGGGGVSGARAGAWVVGVGVEMSGLITA